MVLQSNDLSLKIIDTVDTFFSIPRDGTNSQLNQCESSVLLLMTIYEMTDFVGDDVLITFLDCLFATLWLWDLGLVIFETCEFTIYCNESCFSRNISTNEMTVRTLLRIQFEAITLRIRLPMWDPFRGQKSLILFYRRKETCSPS
jgi:hypothetical protein